MNVTVHLFAAAKDAAKTPELSLELSPSATVAVLREQLVKTCPALAPLQDILHIAVNNNYAASDQIISGDDEIACFPPVSGG